MRNNNTDVKEKKKNEREQKTEKKRNEENKEKHRKAQKKKEKKRKKERTTLSQPLYLVQDICFSVAYAHIHALVIHPLVDCKNQAGLEAAARLGGQRPDVPGSFTNEG